MSGVPTTRTLGKDDWLTPPEVFDPVHAAVDFDLDAAAGSAEEARVPFYISPEVDGLKARWGWFGQRVWCNPPYGRHLKHWLAKAADACVNGCELVCLLIYANVDTAYWREHVADNKNAVAVVFLQPRVSFHRADGGDAATAPKGSALVFFSDVPRDTRFPQTLYWDFNTEAFADVWAEINIGATP